jgi:hypothetical protein
MKFLKPFHACILMPILIPSIYADCNCVHNGDAGRWRDSDTPAARLAEICHDNPGGYCYQAEAGKMCVAGDYNQCDCAVQMAANWQSWHGDWFLWSAITCGGLSITIT